MTTTFLTRFQYRPATHAGAIDGHEVHILGQASYVADESSLGHEVVTGTEGAIKVGLCDTCNEYVYATAEEPNVWVHGSVATRRLYSTVDFVLTPHGTRVLDGDAPAGQGNEEGEEQQRYCAHCNIARFGTFGEWIEAEAESFTQPGSQGGTTWTCEVCNTTEEVNIEL